MTTYFVDSAGSNTSPYDTEAKAATTLDAIEAIPWVAGDIVKVSSAHAETAGAAISYTFPTTPGLQILSVTFNGSGTGGLAAGGSIAVGAANAGINIISGFAYIYGLTLAAGTNNNAACDLSILSGVALGGIKFDSCTLSVPSINTGAILLLGSPGAGGTTISREVKLKNCTINKGNNAAISLGFAGLFIEGLTLSGTAPTTIFAPRAGADAPRTILTASDLSGVAWTNLVDVGGPQRGALLATQCKLRSGFTVATGTFDGPSSYEVILTDCDSGDVHYSYIEECWEGTITTSNAIYADAGNGTDSFSLLMTGNANTSFIHPLVSPEIAQFNDTLSAMTTTVEVTNDGTTFTDAQLWQETLAKITAGSPLGTWNSGDRVADILTSGSNQATSTASWTGTGGFSAEVKQKLVSSSFTPAEVGPLVTVVKLAANDSVYVSPKATAA